MRIHKVYRDKALLFVLICALIAGCQGDDNHKMPAAHQNNATGKISKVGTKFSILKTDKTGISADNKVNETPGFNHFLWASIYNGSGVGIADFDNDGLPDIYMGQNMTGDHLYLNKGGMKFENASSGLPKDIRWTSGVSVVDINNDGLMDIYVCKFGPSKNPADRKNQMLVNLGNGKFEDQAEKYGIADEGWTTQAAFFDVDKDGDKDLYIVNQPPDSRFRARMKISDADKRKLYSDKLLIRSSSGKYVDKTTEYKVQNFAPGLNVLVDDINGDGWLDLYVSNDYEQPDFLYINHEGKYFEDQLKSRVGHISNFSMGSDVADINNDGDNEICVLDMSSADHYRSKTNMGAMNEERFWQNVKQGNYYQYMFNTLQLNQGRGYFSEVAQLAKIAQTDWSWSVLIEDFNLDGLKDIYVTNGIKKDIRNNDFLEIIKKGIREGNSEFETMELLKKVPSNPLSNYYFENKDGLHFDDKTKSSGAKDPNFSTGAGVADFDGDGDYDILVSVSEDPSVILENVTKAPSKKYIFDIDPALRNEFLNASFYLSTSGGYQRKDVIPVRGYLSSSVDKIIFGVPDGETVTSGYVHTIYGDNYELPLKAEKVVKLKKGNLKKIADPQKRLENRFFERQDILDYTHHENPTNDYAKEVLLPHKLSEWGPVAVVNPEMGDLYIGGSAVYPLTQFHKQGNALVKTNQDFWNGFKAGENSDLVFFDCDGDGDNDLLMVNGGNEIQQKGKDWMVDMLFENTGGKWKLKRDFPKIVSNNKTAIAKDIDGDGDNDLLVFGMHKVGNYPEATPSYVLENINGKYKKNNSLVKGIESLGIVSDAALIDFEGDGDEDVVVIGDWESPQVIVFNDKKGMVDSPSVFEGLASWWQHINTGDFDGDGRKDIIMGTFGENNKFHPSKKKPLEIFGNDFDGSGTNDVVLAKHYYDKVVPTRGRECSSQQIPDILEKFPTYNDFALAGIEDILGEEKIQKGIHKKITGMSHMIFWNTPSGWKADLLPKYTQISPLKGSVVMDVNKDGIDDIIGIGNHYGAEVETARYDAGFGWVLLGSNNQKFDYVPPLSAGIRLDGDGRTVVPVNLGKDKYLVACFNNGKARSFRIKE